MALGSVTNCRMGRCTGELGGASIGLTDGGVEVTLTQTIHERKIDMYGDTPVRLYDGGTRAEVTTAIGEHAVDAYTMLVGFSTSSGKAVVGGAVGGVLTTAALVLSSVDTSDPVAEITINEAVILANGPIGFSNAGHRNIPIKAIGIVDTAESDGEMVAKFGAASTLPAISTAYIKGGTTNIDEATDVSLTADFDFTFDKEVFPGCGGTWANKGGGYFILANVTDDALVSLTFTTALVSASEFHIYIDPGTMIASKSYELVVSKYCHNAAGQCLAANTKYDFVTAAA